MRPLRQGAVLLASLLPIASGFAVEASATDIKQCAGLETSQSVQPITDASTRLVLQALVQPQSVENRSSLFEHYLSSTVEHPNSARKVASSHARLVLAAERIQQGRFEEARQTLSKIDLSSTVAVDAALLLAESWRLQGNDAQSQAWLIRVVQRYSSDPQALDGLLLSARDLAADGKIREAWALYSLINDKVLANVEQVGALRDKDDTLVEDLINTRLDESRSIKSQIVKNILQSNEHTALANMRDIIEARQQLDCLANEDEGLKDDAWDESILAANVTSFQTMLKTEARINEQQLKELNAQLVNAPPEARPVIEAEITNLHEQMASLSDRLNELQREQAELPDDSLSQKKQLQQRVKATEHRVEENRVAIRRELDASLDSLQNRYRELAAETQLARAELMQLLANR
ncbi:MAG: hypothetical protein P1U67_04530 [Alcanivoracaceae bacterium]|nr:hypothetical protein [Alcanivoracaceae bacterium]